MLDRMALQRQLDAIGKLEAIRGNVEMFQGGARTAGE
jgi:hypothetical protein